MTIRPATKPAFRIAKKLFVTVLVTLSVFYAISIAAVNYAMHQSPEAFGHFMSRMPTAVFFVVPFETLWMHARAGALHRGEVAPDFTLPTLDKSTTVTLSSFRGHKPVVLIFGSYT